MWRTSPSPQQVTPSCQSRSIGRLQRTAKAPGDFARPAAALSSCFQRTYTVDLSSDPLGHPQVFIIDDATPELTENYCPACWRAVHGDH